MQPSLSLLDRAAKEEREDRELAPYGMRSRDSRGRRFEEPADPLRTVFERDRDRITHSTAFRRLMYKTQVFANWEGDHNRTRLSHSLEVAQVGRSVGGALRLNEALCEALGLAHDIGHPPFGHRGEWALDEIMQGHGGFRHNAQVLRVVDLLERRHPEIPGLNLTFEVRSSLLKHERAEDWPEDLGERPAQPLLEGQVVDLADSTAYDKHDVEDGIQAGMFTEQDLLQEVDLWREARERVEERHPGWLDRTVDRKLRVQRVAGEMMGMLIRDLIEHSHASLLEAVPASPDEARSAPRRLVRHSPTVHARVAALERFLYARFYRHEYLQRFREYAREVLLGLFDAYRRTPDALPPWYRAWSERVGPERAICDYVAGMTDRFVEAEYERRVGPLPAFGQPAP